MIRRLGDWNTFVCCSAKWFGWNNSFSCHQVSCKMYCCIETFGRGLRCVTLHQSTSGAFASLFTFRAVWCTGVLCQATIMRTKITMPHGATQCHDDENCTLGTLECPH